MSLRATNIHIEIGARVLLRDATFVIPPGDKVALVGRNGAGKTTLLRTLAGELELRQGTVELPNKWSWLPQDTSAPEGLNDVVAYDYLIEASRLVELRESVAAAQAAIDDATKREDHDELAKAIDDFSHTEEQFRLGGGYELESTAEGIASGVGLDDEALLQTLGALSGGQRRRLELARMLLRGGDLLILDEPTNHLDVSARNFVVNFLRTTSSAVLMVSHDIELMNESIDRVFSLDNAQLDVYKGTYSEFLKKRAELEESRRREIVNAEREVKRLEKTLTLFQKADETSSRKRKQFEARIDKINDKHLSLPPVKKRNLKLKFPEPVRSGDLVIVTEGLKKSFDDNVVFENVNFIVERGERFIILGKNGAGKTTLMRTIAGRYQPDAGNVKIGAKVALGFYAQEHEDITPGATVLQLIQEAAPHGTPESSLRAMCGHFGLTGEVAKQIATSLSGGEKTKLALARLVAGGANALLLDEPTNNLDPQSREALVGALQQYKGTVVLVSHDLEFVTQLQPERAIMMPEGKLLPFDEDMLDLVPAT